MIRLLAIAASRWTRLVLLALILLSLQTTVLSDLRPFGVMVPLMLLFAVAVGAVHGSEIGAIAGMVVGVIYDCVLTSPLGLSSLVFAAAAIGSGLLPYFVREPTWWSRVIAVAVFGAVGEMLNPVAQGIIGFSGWLHPRVFIVAVVVAMMAGLIAPILIPLSRWTLREAARR